MAKNSYGFDFLKTEHRLNEDGAADNASAPLSISSTRYDDDEQPVVSSLLLQRAQHKPDLEKQFDILAFLQKHRGSGSCLAPSIIYRATGIDLLSTQNATVATLLHNNPKVQTEYVPDPENPALLIPHYAYQAKYPSIRNRTTLLAQINRLGVTGVPARDLLDSYAGIEADIQSLIIGGEVLAIVNSEDKDRVLFARGETFMVELDGIVVLPPTGAMPKTMVPIPNSGSSSSGSSSSNNGNTNGATNGSAKNAAAASSSSTSSSMVEIPLGDVCLVDTDVDPRRQIRRGEAIQVGGQWFRVSSSVRAGVALSDQPTRAQAPLSVTSLTDLSARNEVDGYVRTFTHKTLPLDDTLSTAAKTNLQAAKRARERLVQLAHGARASGGTSGGGSGGSSGGGGAGNVTSQLTGSNAHAANPTTLASSFASTMLGHHGPHGLHNRKVQARPHATSSNNSSNNSDVRPSQSKSKSELSKADLERAAADPALALYSHARRHGCTKDVRDMYLATRSYVPEADYDLQRVLIEHKLLDATESMRRPRLAVRGANVDNDGKPKKRRYYERKDQRMTNTHLEGTEIGALLGRALEKQKQGQSVGDGGM